jgi:hypothetical protein
VRVSRRRLELLRPLSEESNRITDEILRLYKLSDEELLREVGLPRASLATIRELREKLETAEAKLAELHGHIRETDECLNLAVADMHNALANRDREMARANAAEAELAKWRSGALRLATRSPTDDEHRKVDRGTEDEQRQAAGQAGGGFASNTRPKRLIARLESGEILTDDERRELLASWPTSATTPQPVQNSDENPSELDATAGPNVSGQLDLSFSGAAQQRQQIQAALRQGDQDIAANHGHDLGEVLADLDGKPSQVQLAPKPAT